MEGEESAPQNNIDPIVPPQTEQEQPNQPAEVPKSPVDVPKPPVDVPKQIVEPPQKAEENMNTSKRSDINKSNEQAKGLKSGKPASFQISKDVVEFAAPIMIANYIIEKVWKRFEAKQYIENVIYPKAGAYVQDEVLKYTPYLIDKFNYDHDLGEEQVDQDDEFHNWTNEDDYLPPKADSYASDRAAVAKVQIFSHTFPNDLSEIPHEGEDSPDTSIRKSKKNLYLNMNNIQCLEKSSGSIMKSPAPDAKSTASKMQSLNKFKLKAKNHLYASAETIKEIVQVPLPEEIKPEKRVILFKNKDGSTTKRQIDSKLLEDDENDETVIRLRERVNKEEKAKIKAKEQAELEKKQEEMKRKIAEMKINLNSCAFDSDGKVLTKSDVNGDRLPMVGKECSSRYRLSTDHKINSSFAKFKQNLLEMKERKTGGKSFAMKGNEKTPEGKGLDLLEKKKRNYFKSIEGLFDPEAEGDQFALGSVDTAGSNFNAFKPQDGVTIVESSVKVKKGNLIKSSVDHISRKDYLKTFSQKPHELKGILVNSQSMGNLGHKKSQGISFYQEGTLPPIMSPRDRYKNEREEEITHDFELDHSAIPLKRNDEMVIKGGDVSEILNLERTFLDNTNEITQDSQTRNKATFSTLPKYVNRNSRNESVLQTLSLNSPKNFNDGGMIERTKSQIVFAHQMVDKAGDTFSNFNQGILTQADWGADKGNRSKAKLLPKPMQPHPNMKYSPLSPRQLRERSFLNRLMVKDYVTKLTDPSFVKREWNKSILQ